VVKYIVAFRGPGHAVLTVTVNGEPRELSTPDPTVAALVEDLRLAGKRIAVERNGEIVPRARYAATRLAAGDRLEVVVAVGGG
jgi:sulfur carrier protein